MAILNKIDVFLTFFFYRLLPKTVILNHLFLFFSIEGASLFIWLMIIFFIIFFEEKRNPGISQKDKSFLLVFFITFMTIFLINNYLLKNFFKRPRPINNQKLNINNIHCPNDFSLPSSHAATAFGAATILVFFDKKRRWFYYSTAYLIAYSRIYLGCHYFFDVFVGGLIGYFLAKIIITFLSQHYKT